MMNETIQKLLKGEWENHILPFFWQHGEDEKTLRKYMEAIDGANCRAVCVESRPHPDFCGEKWWTDMDVILDEARKRCMADGIPVHGYCYWSLLDNFEWQKGFSMTFGLVAVDRSTKRRTPKESLAYLGSFCEK